MRGMIIYRTRYGATARYARWLSGATGLPAVNMKEADTDLLKDLDFFLIGSTVKFGSLRAARWIKQNWHWLRQKKVVLFSVSGTPAGSEALEAIMQRSLPPEILQQVKWFALPGALDRKNLSFWDGLAIKVASNFERDPQMKERLQKGYNDTDPVHLRPVIRLVESWTWKPVPAFA